MEDWRRKEGGGSTSDWNSGDSSGVVRRRKRGGGGGRRYVWRVVRRIGEGGGREREEQAAWVYARCQRSFPRCFVARFRERAKTFYDDPTVQTATALKQSALHNYEVSSAKHCCHVGWWPIHAYVACPFAIRVFDSPPAKALRYDAISIRLRN